MNTDFFSKPIKKHSITAYRGSTVLAIIGLLIQAWMQHDDAKNKDQTIIQQSQQIDSLVTRVGNCEKDLNYFEGALHIQYHGTVDIRPTIKHNN